VVGTKSRFCAALFLATVAAIAFSAASALAVRGHVFAQSFGEKGVGTGQLEEPSGIAVNESTGDTYVVDKGNDRVEVFNQKDEYQFEINGSATPAGSFENPESIAVDNDPSSPSHGDVYVVDVGHLVVDKFSATGAYIGQITGTPSGHFVSEINVQGLFGVAVDADGDVWVSALNIDGPLPSIESPRVYRFSDQVVNEFKGEVTPERTTTEALASGLAVDSEDNLYVHLSHYPSSDLIFEFNSSGEEISGNKDHAIDTEPPSGVAVEPLSDDVYIDNVSTLARFSSAGSLLERLAVPGGAGGAVGVDGKTGRVYAADPSAGRIEEFKLEPPGPPTLGPGTGSESITKVTAESATFSAEINPRSEPNEPSTEYYFQYGACGSASTCATSAYEASTPIGELNPNYELDSVTASVQDLRAGTVYHFRFFAHNRFDSDDPVESRELTFTTQVSGSVFALPDGRQWEMVSPPDKHGALIEPIGEAGVIEAAAGGDALTFLADTPTESEPRGYGNSIEQVLSTRTADGWSSQDIALPHNVASGFSIGQGDEYRYFSSDLSRALIEPQGEFIPLTGEETSPEATEGTLYERADSTCQATPASCYTPLVTEANTPPGTKIGRPPEGLGINNSKAHFVGATPDLSHVVLSSTVALTSTPSGGGLYEWAAGQLQLVSVRPASEGGATANAEFGVEGGDGGNSVGGNAISADGSRLIWSSNHDSLYMRDTATEETVRLDLPEAECLKESTCGNEPAEPTFRIASSDGSEVFFTDTQRLTTDSRAGRVKGSSTDVAEPDLYVCQMVEVEVADQKKLKCDLTDLSADTNPDGERADVSGVLDASDDGSYVYFAASGVLGDGAEHGATPGDCSSLHPEPSSTCNLYVEHYDGSAWEAPDFIATVSLADADDWQYGGRHGTAQSSPDGSYLAFMSQRSLTEYDNLDAVSGEPDEEVYLYDAATHRLVCASCNPTGARPVGEEYADQENVGLSGGDSVWEPSTWLAANVPGWTSYELDAGAHQPRYLSDGGRLFFNSHEALVPEDVNGTWDVYEYEPPGIGTCTTAAVTFSELSGGCVGLISSGESPEESAFLDASESGGDVFFLTASQLVPQDYDYNRDVYDAHECTGVSPCFPTPAVHPPPCTTEASCKSAPTPQPTLYAPPASATFSGPGNLAPSPPPAPAKVTEKKTVTCKKGLVRSKKGGCVKEKKPKKKAKKSSKKKGK
jgi:hypothetical protein